MEFISSDIAFHRILPLKTIEFKPFKTVEFKPLHLSRLNCRETHWRGEGENGVGIKWSNSPLLGENGVILLNGILTHFQQ